MNGIPGKLLLIFTELLIPILGYFFWNWDFIFIMLFFVIDWFVLILFHFVKINTYRKLGFNAQDKQFVIRASILFISSFLAALTIAILSFNKIIKNFSLTSEISDFMHYKDTGIEQGYLLIPICLLSGYLIHKREFILPKVVEFKTIQSVFKNSIIIHLFIPAVVSIICILGYLCQLSTEVLLYISLGCIIVGKVYFQTIKSES